MKSFRYSYSCGLFVSVYLGGDDFNIYMPSTCTFMLILQCVTVNVAVVTLSCSEDPTELELDLPQAPPLTVDTIVGCRLYVSIACVFSSTYSQLIAKHNFRGFDSDCEICAHKILPRACLHACMLHEL